MTARWMAALWAASLCTAVLLSTLFYYVGAFGGAAAWAEETGFDEALYAQTVFVGSSLTGAAIPPRFVLDREDHIEDHAIRRWLALMTEKEVVHEARTAIAEGATRVFIELRPLTRPVDEARMRLRINKAASTLRTGMRATLSGTKAPNPLEANGQWVSKNYTDQRSWPGYAFKYKFAQQDTALLEALLETAAASGVDIYFLSYPRAEGAQELVTGTSYQEIRQALVVLAARFDRPLFQPSLQWSDDYFADRMHLNQRGRDRYVAELKSWLVLQ